MQPIDRLQDESRAESPSMDNPQRAERSDGEVGGIRTTPLTGVCKDAKLFTWGKTGHQAIYHSQPTTLDTHL